MWFWDWKVARPYFAIAGIYAAAALGISIGDWIGRHLWVK